MDRNEIADLIQQRKENQTPLATIQTIDDSMISINGHPYKLILNFLDQFDLEDLKKRYNPAFNKYDFILGDYSYGKLRLTGFYADNRDVESYMKVNSLNDYISEYCNFGSAYFILHNLEANSYHRSQSNFRKGRGNRGYIKEKVTKKRPPIQKRKNLVVKGKGKRKFVIKQKK